MQVQHTFEAENYAIVGGIAAPRAFKIGQSAHAFRILSDTLYSNKKLAVVREIICNAIDAHIAAGKADVPVEVKLTATEFRVQDFGLGIPDDRIVDIYATYFGSNKQADNTQTGGFGLGSKSPFAYTDHFTVISCHEGLKTIYALHIDDEVNGGAPAVRPMGAMDTTETGVTVAVPLTVESDQKAFENLIRNVVRDGGMLVKLNGELLPHNDYTEIRKHGFGLIPGGDGDYHVLYANVLYPLPHNLTARIRFAADNTRTILYAPPSTLSVTPSRESLSMDAKTTAFIEKLLQQMSRQIKPHVDAARKAFLTETAAKATPWQLAPQYSYNGGEPVKSPVAGGKNVAHALISCGAISRGFYDRDYRKLLYRRFRLKALLGFSKRNKKPFQDDFNSYHYRDVSDAYLLKVLMRAERRLGLKGTLRCRDFNRASLVMVDGKFSRNSHEFTPVLYLAAGVAHVRHHSNQKNGYHMIIPKLDEEMVRRVRAELDKFKIGVTWLQKPNLPPRPKPKPKPPVTGLLLWDTCGYTTSSTDIPLLKLANQPCEQPTSYVYAAEMRFRDGGHQPHIKAPWIWHTFDVAKALQARYPGIAIVRNTTELVLAQKAKLPRLGEVLLKEAQRRAKKACALEKRYIELADKGRRHQRRSNEIEAIIVQMFQHSREMAHAALDLPYRPNRKLDEAYVFWQEITNFFAGEHVYGSFKGEEGEGVATSETRASWFKLQEQLIKEAGERKSAPHLYLISALSGGIGSVFLSNYGKHYLELVRLQAKMTKSTPNTEKEAA